MFSLPFYYLAIRQILIIVSHLLRDIRGYNKNNELNINQTFFFYKEGKIIV